MQDMRMRDKMSRVENAESEGAGPPMKENRKRLNFKRLLPFSFYTSALPLHWC